MFSMLPRAVWHSCIGPLLAPRDICHLSATCRTAHALFRDEGFWTRRVQDTTDIRLPTGGPRGANAWRLVFASLYNATSVEPLRNAVRLAHISQACALPPKHLESVSFFLYWYWSGPDRIADHLRVFKLSPGNAKVKGAHSMLQIDVDVNPTPFLVYGHMGIRSCVDVVVVARSLPGNRQVLFSFDSFFGVARASADPRKPNFTNVSRQSCGTGEAMLLMRVSTPSRANYRDLGQLCHGNPEHYFDLASARVATMSHAEGRNFSSRDVDQRLLQSTASLPSVPAGGVVEMRVRLPIDFLFERAFPALAAAAAAAADPMDVDSVGE